MSYLKIIPKFRDPPPNLGEIFFLTWYCSFYTSYTFFPTIYKGVSRQLGPRRKIQT